MKKSNALLDRFKTSGGIGTGEVVAREVVWNGQTFPLHFLDLPGGKVQELLKRPDADAEIVAASLVLEDGSPAMDLEDAHRLKLTLREAIVRAAMDVFGFTATARAEKKTGSDPTQ